MKIERETIPTKTTDAQLDATYTVKMTGHDLIRVLALSYSGEGGDEYPTSGRFCDHGGPIAKLFPDWEDLIENLKDGKVVR